MKHTERQQKIIAQLKDSGMFDHVDGDAFYYEGQLLGFEFKARSGKYGALQKLSKHQFYDMLDKDAPNDVEKVVDYLAKRLKKIINDTRTKTILEMVRSHEDGFEYAQLQTGIGKHDLIQLLQDNDFEMCIYCEQWFPCSELDYSVASHPDCGQCGEDGY